VTDRYTGPAIESPLRDVTPPEMATGQAQPTTFSSRGPEYRLFERLCSPHPFSSLFCNAMFLRASLSLFEIARQPVDPSVDQRGPMKTRDGQFRKFLLLPHFFFMNNVI